MPTCGNCQKEVAASDVTCPHCGVLLAAYTSPIGSGAAGTYEAPPPPPSTEIPSVDMEVKPPSEAEVVTDPAEVAEEPVSTAPRPLFDTYLTVEEIARAAEGDHAEDVVTVTNKKIETKTVEFEVPDYARPPADAAPIPTIDEDDDSIPLITRDEDPARRAQAEVAREPADAPEQPAEQWLQSPPPEVTPNPKGTAVARPAADSTPAGETDAYLRKLHAQAGYEPAQAVVSRPVEADRPSAGTRAQRFFAAQQAPRRKRLAEETVSTEATVVAFYGLALIVLWFGIISALLGGHFSTPVFVIAVLLTWAFKPVRKFLNEMNDT